MKVYTESLIEGAKRASGVVVIIDVFRACTTAAHIIDRGAQKVLLFEDVNDVFNFKKENPSCILVGERQGIKIEGFDHGNSPYEISRTDLRNKTVIFTTSSGTKGVHAVQNAEEILLGSFVNAAATIRYIKEKTPEKVFFVAIGELGLEKTDEDELCAKYFKELLEGKVVDFNQVKDKLKNCSAATKFFDKNRPEFEEEDFHCATSLDKFNFVLKVIKNKENLQLITV